ncbi:MAG: CPBP family intramembrane metalloprotease [Acidobacteriia bacterium]|nr:CPBP family intramembrane metalloprotease [Terriglobia bacterium]
MTGRTGLMIVAQAFVACLFWIQKGRWSWNAAAPWWSVYGTLVDIGCLGLMVLYSRKEGIRLRDLIGRPRLRWGRDVFVGIGCLVVVFPFFMAAAPVVTRLVYGSGQPPLYPGLLTARALPLWATVYSLSLWWLVWSPTEEMTYLGYAFPRIEALSRGRWIAVVIVGFWWALQHAFLPLVLDWQYIAWRFLAFLPGVVVLTLLYLKVRRLPPLILAHWTLDILAMLITLKF